MHAGIIDYNRAAVKAESRASDGATMAESIAGACGPVGAALDRTGALLIAEGVGNAVWRVSGRARPSSM